MCRGAQRWHRIEFIKTAINYKYRMRGWLIGNCARAKSTSSISRYFIITVWWRCDMNTWRILMCSDPGPVDTQHSFFPYFLFTCIWSWWQGNKTYKIEPAIDTQHSSMHPDIPQTKGIETVVVAHCFLRSMC